MPYSRAVSDIIPQTDSFTEEATHLGDVHSGYARLIAWTTDTASGDSNVCAAGHLHNGYFQGGGTLAIGTTGRFAAAKGLASVGQSDLMSFVWRPFYSVRAKARLAIRWKRISGAATVADFRRAAVGVRLQNHGAYSNTAGAETVTGGDGYWLVARNVGTQPGAMFYLLRVNAGVTSLLATSTAVDVSEWALPRGMWFYVTISNVSGNPQIRCRRGPTSVESVGGTLEVDIFSGGDVTDTSGSKITTAGRCGFALSRPILGSVPLADWFEVTDPNTGEVVLRDEWLRANYLVGALTAPDANSVTGRNLQPSFAGSVGGSASTRIARDSGNNRVKNDSTSASINAAQSFRASHEAIQRRSADVRFNFSAGVTGLFQIDLRGAGLHDPTASAARCYRLEISGHDALGIGVKVYVVTAGVAVLLATKAPDGLNYAADHVWDFAVSNVGGATPLDGVPHLVVRKDSVQLATWTMASVAGVSSGSDGTIIDTRSAAILSGWEQAWRFSLSPGEANAVYVDDWLDSAVLATDPDNDIPSATVSTEITGLSGTLSAAHSWKMDVTYRRPALRHEYESDHAQAFAIGSRTRRVWSVEMPAATQAEVDALDAFWQTHGAAIPFNWTVEGEAVYGVFVKDSKEVRRLWAGAFSYAFEVEERFA